MCRDRPDYIEYVKNHTLAREIRAKHLGEVGPCKMEAWCGFTYAGNSAAGMAGLIGFQGFLNIGVNTGLLPNTGVTLPFVSYGLTSLVSLYIGVGFVLNVGLQCKKY